MNKTLCLTAALLVLSYAAFCMPIRGQVKAGKKGLSQVIITDGFHFTQTDRTGNFQLDTDEQAKFIYLVTPEGYIANYQSGTPEFYLPLNAQQANYTFNLTALGKSKDYTLLAIADVQTRTDEQFQRFQNQSIPDLKKTIARYSPSSSVIGISLGDIVWDHFDHFPTYKKEMAQLKVPFFPVIGNHDHDKEIVEDKASAQVYEDYFGPTYYAFQLGGIYCIVLDNILYEGHKKYTEALTDDQIEWVEKLLNFIPQGTPLLVATHSPFYYANRGIIPGGEKLFKTLQNHPVNLISGHTHLNSNHEIQPGIIEHNIGAICGTWWTADENRDGTPNGYAVFEISGSNLQWYYKSVGYDRNWQFKTYPQGTVKEKANSVIAKVWNWDEKWSVQWYEDGIAKGEMQRFNGYDPDYLEYISSLGTEKYTQPAESFFYFLATPSDQARKVEVEVTDRFGHTYPRQEVLLK